MIISFYSYKGGVGRSQMCANVAAYLALKKGKKVLLWDWDFEAPGLHYYFDKTNADIQNISTIEVLDAYSNMMRTTSDVSEADYKYFPSKAFVPLVELTKTRLGEGKVDLLPGGNYNDNYVNKINRFNWFEFYELLDGSVYIESLKNWAKSLEYDYILIDSRTGINDYSGICNLQLPDTNVVVMAANEQNIAGCRRIIDQITHHEYVKQGYRKPYLFPVLSRINANNPDYQKWSERFTDEFYELLPKLDTDINPLFTKEIFRDFYLEKTLLEDDPRFSAGENLLFNTTRQTFPKNALISKYVNISEYFENLKAGNSIEINNEIDIATWEGYAEEAILDENKNKAAYAFEKAEQYDKSIEYGGTAQVFMEKANDASLNNKQKEAIVFYEKAIEIDANNENAFFYMGLAYYGLQEYSESIKCYEKAIAIRPDLHEAFNNMGLACYKLQEYSEAIKCYENAIEIKPDDHEAFNNMGNAYYGLQEYSESIKSYEKAISIKHDYHEAFYNMGNAYDELQEYSESIKCYEKAIEIKPDFHEAFYNMGNTYNELNEYSESIKSYEKAISIKHDYHEAFYNMGLAYRKLNEYSESIKSYEKAISIKHDYHEAFYNMGNTYNELNEYSESIKCYEKAISIKPDKHEAFYNMGNAYDELQEYSESIKSYEKAISIKHDYHEAFYNMGLAYRKLNEYSESIKCYEKAISIKHDYHEAFNNMGFAYDELQEYLESIKCYEKAIAIKHDYSSPYINLGFTLFKTGNFPKAENILKQGIELGSIDLNNMNLGHVYLTQDKETAALVCYVKAYNAFDNKEQYWEGMEDDFQYLEHHGVSKAYYRGILEKIKSRVE